MDVLHFDVKVQVLPAPDEVDARVKLVHQLEVNHTRAAADTRVEVAISEGEREAKLLRVEVDRAIQVGGTELGDELLYLHRAPSRHFSITVPGPSPRRHQFGENATGALGMEKRHRHVGAVGSPTEIDLPQTLGAQTCRFLGDVVATVSPVVQARPEALQVPVGAGLGYDGNQHLDARLAVAYPEHVVVRSFGREVGAVGQWRAGIKGESHPRFERCAGFVDAVGDDADMVQSYDHATFLGRGQCLESFGSPVPTVDVAIGTRARTASVVPQRLDRVELRGAPCRPDAEY